MEELEKNIRELLQANEERRRAEQGARKWKKIFWSVVVLCALAVLAQAQSGDYSTTTSLATAGNSGGSAQYWAWAIAGGALAAAGLAARARMKRIEEAEARENSCGEYGCIDGGVPFQFAQRQQDTTYIIQQQPFPQPQRQIIYVQAPAQQQLQPQTEVVYLQAPPVQQQRQQAQRQMIYLPAPQQQPQYGYLTEVPPRDVRYLPEEAPYRHQAPQEVYYDPRAYQQKQPVRYMPQETYQPDPRGSYPQVPQSYYTGPGADPYIVEYVEEYQPAKYISRGQQPVGQLPAPSASTIDEARRRFEKERNEMKRRR